MGDDHPRPGITCDHSTFSVFDQCSASRACFPTGFASGPRNWGQAMPWLHTLVTSSIITNVCRDMTTKRASRPVGFNFLCTQVSPFDKHFVLKRCAFLPGVRAKSINGTRN